MDGENTLCSLNIMQLFVLLEAFNSIEAKNMPLLKRYKIKRVDEILSEIDRSEALKD